MALGQIFPGCFLMQSLFIYVVREWMIHAMFIKYKKTGNMKMLKRDIVLKYFHILEIFFYTFIKMKYKNTFVGN